MTGGSGGSGAPEAPSPIYFRHSMEVIASGRLLNRYYGGGNAGLRVKIPMWKYPTYPCARNPVSAIKKSRREEVDSENCDSTKKEYQPPEVRVYGGVEEITGAASSPGSHSDTRFGFLMDTRTH
jgi:hypothetical protein